MDYTKLDLRQCFDLACQEFGLADPHMISIGQLIDLVKAGHLDPQEARRMAQIIYDHGTNSLYYNDAWDDEEHEEDYLDNEDYGFDPYMGCYTGDC